MNNILKTWGVRIFLLGLSMFVIVACSDDTTTTPEDNPDTSPTELLSLYTSTAPNLDGKIDDMWRQAQRLITTVQVPDPKSAEGRTVFAGYVGDEYDVTMRSMFDNEYIYFLVEWNDLVKDFDRDSWYFDTDSKTWKQESRWPTFDENGNVIRKAYYEDKFTMLFNVNESTSGWDNATCYATCHLGLPDADGGARHYTNAANESIDMWHWKSVRTGFPLGQADDQFQNNDQPNGRHSDPKISGAYTDNVQMLQVIGTEDTVKVPMYLIPGKSNYYWILQSEIDDNTARKIVGVDSDGKLFYNGGVIDPVADAAFQRDGSKRMPSIYTAPIVGNRGDIEAAAVHSTSTGWTLELKRKLNTGDADNVDVNFSSLKDFFFGIGVMDNAAIAHAIKTNLLLRFGKTPK